MENLDHRRTFSVEPRPKEKIKCRTMTTEENLSVKQRWQEKLYLFNKGDQRKLSITQGQHYVRKFIS